MRVLSLTTTVYIRTHRSGRPYVGSVDRVFELAQTFFLGLKVPFFREEGGRGGRLDSTWQNVNVNLLTGQLLPVNFETLVYIVKSIFFFSPFIKTTIRWKTYFFCPLLYKLLNVLIKRDS